MASVSLIKRTNPEREAALDQGWTRTSDKAQKRDQSDGPSHEPRQTTRLCLRDKGLFEARCQQCQGGSAFPDDGFCSRPPAASGAGREATHCSLGRPFIPARSAAARPTRAANPRPRVAAAAGNPGAGNRLAMTRTEEAMSAAGLAVRGGGVPGGREDGPTA